MRRFFNVMSPFIFLKKSQENPIYLMKGFHSRRTLTTEYCFCPIKHKLVLSMRGVRQGRNAAINIHSK